MTLTTLTVQQILGNAETASLTYLYRKRGIVGIFTMLKNEYGQMEKVVPIWLAARHRKNYGVSKYKKDDETSN